MFKTIIAVFCLTLVLGVFLHAQTPASQPASQTRVMPSGLAITDQPGDEWVTQEGDAVHVTYVGKLQNGQQFDAGGPLAVTIGRGEVIKGWDEGLQGMKLGQKRHLTIPPALAYGERGAGNGKIPPNATLEFDVQVVGIVRGGK